MKKPIQRASGRQGKVQHGIKSEVHRGFASTDQFNVWKDEMEAEHYEDIKVEYDKVRLPHWSHSRKVQDKIMEVMSGEVKSYHISELPEEERKKYEKPNSIYR